MVRTRAVRRSFDRPLTVFAVILVGGGGPLVTAYGLSSSLFCEILLAVAAVVLVLGSGAFFCYMVRYHPRHLFRPDEIPREAYGRSIFEDVDEEARRSEDAEGRARTKFRQELQQELIPALQGLGLQDELLNGVVDSVGEVAEDTANDAPDLLHDLREIKKYRRLIQAAEEASQAGRRMQQEERPETEDEVESLCNRFGVSREEMAYMQKVVSRYL